MVEGGIVLIASECVIEDRISLDFETFSKANIKNVGACRYAQDKSTEVLCLSYAFNREEPKIWIPGDPPPQDLFDRINKGALVYAWNAAFEYAIWEDVCIPDLGWPPIPLLQWRDTQAIALMFALPMSLGKCGDALHMNIHKDKRGDYLIKKLSVPQKTTRNQPHRRLTPELKPKLFEEMYGYCKQDVNSERAILDELPWGLIGDELDIWRATLLKNRRGIPIDIELVNSIVEVVDDYIDEISAMIPIITGGRIRTINQRQKIMDWCEEQGYELPDFTADTIDKCLEDPDLENFPPVKNILNIRSLAGKSSIKKFKKIQEAICVDGVIRDCLKYHKATTGREGGRLLQPQNLPRAEITDKAEFELTEEQKIRFTDRIWQPESMTKKELRKALYTEHAIEAFKSESLTTVLEDYDNVIYAASALIRPSILARPGYKLLISDYSSVENRGVCWLAGQDDVLEMMIKGMDLYKDMASALYNLPYDQIPKDSEMRRHGKLTILGCGYGMGWKKFMEDCIGRGFNMTEKEAKRTIDIFREKYYAVKQFWYDLKEAAIWATTTPGKMFSVNHISFIHEHGYLFMILPNGKPIAYPEAVVKEVKVPWGYTTTVVHKGKHPKTKKWVEIPLTPGRLAENAAQASCREIVMEAKLDVIREGHDVFLTVHDEIVVEAPINGMTINQLNNILCNREEYWDGLPLAAAGCETFRYKK